MLAADDGLKNKSKSGKQEKKGRRNGTGDKWDSRVIRWTYEVKLRTKMHIQ